MTYLSPGMRFAYDVIRSNDVTYTYRKLSPSTRRALQVTTRDITPIYSHGLNAATVEALIRRRLVQLSPYSPGHGRVVDCADN